MYPATSTGHLGVRARPLLTAVPGMVAPEDPLEFHSDDEGKRVDAHGAPIQRAALAEAPADAGGAPTQRAAHAEASDGSCEPAGAPALPPPQRGWGAYTKGNPPPPPPRATAGTAPQRSRRPARNASVSSSNRSHAGSQVPSPRGRALGKTPASGGAVVRTPTPRPRPRLAEANAKNYQQYAAQAWQDTNRRPIGTRPFGPMPGLQVLQPDWDIHASRFARNLVHNASLEKMSVFGPTWDTNNKNWHQLQNSGITALGITFYEMKDLQELCRKMPETADPSFGELVSKHRDDKDEVILATWYPGFVLKHGVAEIEQCEYWISQTHPGEDHFCSAWAAWPPRVRGGQSLTPCACAFLWNASRDGPFFCPDEGRPNMGPEMYHIDRVPDDSQFAAVRRAVYTLCSQYASAADRIGMGVPVLLALSAPGLIPDHARFNRAGYHIEAAKRAARIASHELNEPVRHAYLTSSDPEPAVRGLRDGDAVPTEEQHEECPGVVFQTVVLNPTEAALDQIGHGV